MHISAVVKSVQEQWGWFIIWPPDVLYCSLLSLCVRMERILLILLETEEDRLLDTHINSSQLPTLSLCQTFSSLSHTHYVLPFVLFMAANEYEHSHTCVCKLVGVCTPSPQLQLSTHHLGIVVVPLVVTYRTPLPCMEDLDCALWLWSTSHQPYRERHYRWNAHIHT